jgi:hypothetical protein
MSFFSPADPGPTQQAAAQAGMLQTALAQAAQGTLTDYSNQALGALGTNYDAARGALTQNFYPALNALTSGYTGAQGAVNSNYALGQDQLKQAMAGYSPYTNAGTAATNTELGALGLGGPAGYSTAMDAFHLSPQYQFNLDQATANSARGMNRYGMLSSGNTVDAITRLGSNLASGEFGNWLKNLDTVSGRGLQGVTGQAGLFNTSGQLFANQGNNIGNLMVGQGTGASNLYTGQGSGLGNLFASQGTGSANILTGLGSNIAGVQQNLGNQLSQDLRTGADAQTQADTANRNWDLGLAGLGMRGIGLAAAPFTGGTSLGLSGIGSGASSFGGLGFNPFGATSGIRGA